MAIKWRGSPKRCGIYETTSATVVVDGTDDLCIRPPPPFMNTFFLVIQSPGQMVAEHLLCDNKWDSGPINFPQPSPRTCFGLLGSPYNASCRIALSLRYVTWVVCSPGLCGSYYRGRRIIIVENTLLFVIHPPWRATDRPSDRQVDWSSPVSVRPSSS